MREKIFTYKTTILPLSYDFFQCGRDEPENSLRSEGKNA